MRHLAILMTLAGLGPMAAAAQQDTGSPDTAALVAEPQVPTGKFTTATEVRPILDATRASWVAVREFDRQDLVYVTHLWAWRCGLAEIRVGLNGAVPEVWPMPPCHVGTAAPNAVQDGDGLPYRSFPLGSVQSVQVDLVYDDLGTDQGSFERSSVLIP